MNFFIGLYLIETLRNRQVNREIIDK
ncbi:hypothetical protein [Plasmodium yoelii yoelii]|uniref:Uncharacterized protein n=1 Tax=Plasmodium yoelii yoelii TaxID=73239 RepID=Q7RB48_PLAYO|nr:hypothetical protein [Plasmodium yoelii yoelii]